MQNPTRLFDFPYYQMEKFPLKLMMKSLGDSTEEYSSQSFIEQMNKASRGLLAKGVQPSDKIGLISHNNRCEWNVMDQGILQIGAIDVPIYPTMSPEDIQYILNHAEVKLCFVSNEELFHKVQSIKSQVPTLKEVYTFEKVNGAPNWHDVLNASGDVAQEKVDEIAAGIKPEELATLIYTSGTTGLPKGVMLSHHNICTNAIDSSERVPTLYAGKSRCLSFLPVCHIFERMLHYMYMYNGVSIYFGQSLETIKEDLQASRPHMFTGVPRLFEKFFDGIVAKGAAAGGIKSKLFAWAVATALQWEPDGKNGGWYEFKINLARKLVFSKVKEALGLTEIAGVASGSAALQAKLARFFNGAGIPLLEGYGLTETSPVISVNTINQPGMIKVGTVGKIISNVKVKIAADGEILCSGPNVMMGYYKDPERTADVLKDGWFHTGDIGELDGDGFLKITDRKKEIFKTSGGKYIAPQIVENALKESIFVEQCIVVGEGKNFPSALIVPSFDALRTWCEKHGISYTSDKEMVQNQKIIDRVQKDVDKANERFGKWEQVKKFTLLPELWTIEADELTPTLKLKRKQIHQRYASQIEALYS
ncbi:MAG: long-chain fatty acid--CoA ligase [Cryomorphaceae bacterium]|nr:MAG: long-chain fatty acid--CoA ligase [Cryomorphaceae bacterium]